MTFCELSVKSRKLGFPVEICVCVPDSGTDIPTLWLLHGANSDRHEWFDETSLVRYLQGRGMAAVTVSVHNGFYVNMASGADWADYLENEFVPSVRGLFPCLSREREKNWLAGASMGGFGAFRLAMNRPDLFSKAGSFAGSVEMPSIIERNARGIQPGGPDFGWAFGGYENMINNSNDVIWLARQCEDKALLPELYMICGADDFGYALSLIARDDLLAAGCSVIWKEIPGIHSYNCWDPAIPAFLDWLEGKGEENP